MTKYLEKKDAHGRLVTVGIEPIVTVAGHQLNWTENDEYGNKPKELSIKIKGLAYGTDIKDGKLDFTLKDGFIFGGSAPTAKHKVWLYGKNTPEQLRAESALKPVMSPLLKAYFNGKIKEGLSLATIVESQYYYPLKPKEIIKTL